ncbi:hypothetical protein H0H81_007615 [Sphagnurus paluster]|uniref:Uncharacterized protein n=1 Tax=Sphagnurus paluster TaxID=117069 RepID=A0A9P7FQZ7_9AGAR|nr:hypothetical protein H0H81_007615 [Sphagnurus paluster]
MINIIATSAVVRPSIVRASLVNIRGLHSTPVAAKNVTEKVSEVAEKVNKKVGQGLASAIETGENATRATKESLGSAKEDSKEKLDHASKVAGEKTNQVFRLLVCGWELAEKNDR